MEVDALTPDAGSVDALTLDAGSLDPVSLDALTEALDRLGRVDPAVLADPESVVSLQRQLARLEALTTRATAAFDRAGHWAPDGARTASAWLSVRCRIPKAEARRRVRRGRALCALPETERAWTNGDLAGAHVEVMASLSGPETEEALARDEALLVGQACHLRFDQFSRRWPTGSSWPIPRAPTPRPKPAGPAVTSTWSPASPAPGSGP